MDYIKKIFSPEDAAVEEALPSSWHQASQGPVEQLGPHPVQEVLPGRGPGRLLLAHFNGNPKQPVMIKQYPFVGEGLREEPALAERLARELAAYGKIRHRALHPLKSFSLAEDVYLIFDVFPNKTLQDLLDRPSSPLGKLPLKDTLVHVERLLQLADLLHQQGLKLGEITPGSLWLTKDNEVRLLTGQCLLDYQYHRRAEKLTAASSDIHTMDVDQMVVDYMPPELVRGEPTGPSSDQYVIGAILFRLLTQKSVAGEDPMVLNKMMKIATGKPPVPSQHDPALGTAFDELLQRMLARDPKERFPSCSDAVPALLKAAGQS